MIEHIIECLARIQLLGRGDRVFKTAPDEVSNAQFYTFLNRMVQNKVIERP